MVKFNLPSLPLGANVDSASIRMGSNWGSGGWATIGMARALGSSTEGGVTWSYQPATSAYYDTRTVSLKFWWQSWNATKLVRRGYRPVATAARTVQ